MDAAQVVFMVTALVILVSAGLVVTTRNLVHAALWLIATLFGVAVLFATLNAGFLAVVQVVIYIGAIAILFIFAVMLTRKELLDRGHQHNPGWWLGAALAALVFLGVTLSLESWERVSSLPKAISGNLDPVSALGYALTDPDMFVLPFEIASVLLVAALVGAVYAAFAGGRERS